MSAATSEPLLSAKGVSYAYPGRPLFRALTAEFPAGLTWLQGSNGCGKSTLLKLLGGVIAPQAGQVQVQGIEEAQEPQAYRRAVFWCGPDALPFDHLTPLEYLGFMAGLYPRFDSSAVAHHLEGLNLQPLLGTPIGGLSTGTRRKVWLVAALVVGTPAVLLDEPFNALDVDALAHLQRVLERAAIEMDRCWVVASHGSPTNRPLRTFTLGPG